jgi:hypothetical protein
MPDASESSPEPATTRQKGSNFWSRQRGLAWPAALLLVVLGLASFSWPCGLRVSGRLIASAVNLTLKQAATVQSDLALRPPQASITGAAAIELPPGIGGGVIRRQRMPVGATLNADGGSLLLSSLAFGPDMDLTIQHSARDGLTLYARGADGTIEFEVGGPVVLGLDGAGQQHATLDPPENIAVRTDRLSAVPTAVQTRTNDPLVIENLPVSRLAFTRALSAGGRGSPFVSSIISGAVQLVDTARSESLDSGSALVLERFEGWVVRVETAPDGFAVSFTGTARRVSLGPLGHPNDLTPSILEFLYRQQWINMMWISALAGMAVVAKVRSWAVGKLED